MATIYKNIADEARMREACLEDATAIARIRTRAFVDDPIKDWVSFSNESLFSPRWQHMFLSNGFTTHVVTVSRAVGTSLDGTPDYDLEDDLRALQDVKDSGRIVVGFTMFQYKCDESLQPPRQTSMAKPRPMEEELELEQRRRYEIVVKSMSDGLERNMSPQAVHERSLRRHLTSSASTATQTPPVTRGTDISLTAPPSTADTRPDSRPDFTTLGQTTSANSASDSANAIVGDGGDSSTIKGQPWIYVQYVGVHPIVARRGVGGKVLRHVQSLADSHGCQAYLESSAVGLPFYLANGFTNLHDEGGDVILHDPQGRAPTKNVPCLVYVPRPGVV